MKTDVRSSELVSVGEETRRRQWSYRIGRLLLLLAVVGLWQLLPTVGLVSTIILPTFTDVVAALWTLVLTPFFLGHFTVTLTEIGLGFLLGTSIGLLLGIALAVSRPMKELTYPFVVGFQAIPKVVFAPLFIAWFGFGQTSKVVMAIVISFFPVLINTMVGLESVPEEARRLMRSLLATRLQVFWKVSLLHALPVILAGVKAAFTFAVIGAIVGEFVGASEGLGFLLNLYNFQLRIDRVFAVIIVLAAMGAVGYFGVEWIDRKVIFWRQADGTR